MTQPSMSMIKNVVEHLVKGLVENSDAVKVDIQDSGESAVVSVLVQESEKGRLIGRDGKTINAIRMLVGALAAPDKKVSVEIAQK